jgi:hypothetical protein
MTENCCLCCPADFESRQQSLVVEGVHLSISLVMKLMQVRNRSSHMIQQKGPWDDHGTNSVLVYVKSQTASILHPHDSCVGRRLSICYLCLIGIVLKGRHLERL